MCHWSPHSIWCSFTYQMDAGTDLETQEQVTCLPHIKSTRVIFMMLFYIYTIYKLCAVIFIENKLTKTTRCVNHVPKRVGCFSLDWLIATSGKDDCKLLLRGAEKTQPGVYHRGCLSVCGQPPPPHKNAHTVCRPLVQWERRKRRVDPVDVSSESSPKMDLVALLFVILLLGPEVSRGRRSGRLSKAEQSLGLSIRHRYSIHSILKSKPILSFFQERSRPWPPNKQLQLRRGERHFPLENWHKSELKSWE